jgi:hypothetical protein
MFSTTFRATRDHDSSYYSAESSIPVVQGQVVSDTGSSTYQGTDFPPPQGNYSAHAEDVSFAFRGKQQPNQCKDAGWAILFYAHLGVMLFVTIRNVPLMAQDLANIHVGGVNRKLSSALRFLQDGEEVDASNYNNNYKGNWEEETVEFDLGMASALTIVALIGLAAFLLSSATVGLMMAVPKQLIKMALLFTFFLTAATTITFLLAGAIPAAIMIGALCMFNIFYIREIWSRIPFAAANLITAVTAVKSNMGLIFFAYNSLLVTFFWIVWWSIAFVTTGYLLIDCSNAEGPCENDMNEGLAYLFVISLLWTAQVVKNVVHVTVAGTVGTWWLFPQEASGCCSQAVRDSHWRSITTSFGSICLGSLILSFIKGTRENVNSTTNQNDGLALCIANCLERLGEYFNRVCTSESLVEMSNLFCPIHHILSVFALQWAYVYVGLYGYGFVEASINVLSLFKSRGWTAIVADTLVDTVLLLLSFGIGLLTGLVGLIAATSMQQDSGTMVVAFFFGMLIGASFCSTLFGLISSGVNAVIVLFAENPAEFAANYPQLSQEMLKTWREAYPGDFMY